jgi:hypothetical protein
VRRALVSVDACSCRARPMHDGGAKTIAHNFPMATIVRCSRGALFETIWVPLVSFKAIRLGSKRLQRCPVHARWELVQRADPSTLTPAERAEGAEHPAGPIP